MSNIKCVKFPKIEQFRNVIASLNRRFSFVGIDENGEPIYDPYLEKPTLTFTGTVKLHGTNAAVSFNSKNGLWTQSRNNAFTLDKHDSHFGFTFFVNQHRILFKNMFHEIALQNDINYDELTVTIYGEWAGKGIQKGVAISELDKAFYIFGVKVSKLNDPEYKSWWIDHSQLRFPDSDKIFNIFEFENYSIDVDFNNPQLVSNQLAEITNKVEQECPVAKHFGVSGIGEGVVWSVEYDGNKHSFKVKGEKHSVSKVKTLAPVDAEKLNSIQEFVDYACTENRVKQAMGEVFSSPDEYSTKKTGDVLRWIINDIMAEEMDVMTKNGLTPKDVNKHISTKARQIFFKEIEI